MSNTGQDMAEVPNSRPAGRLDQVIYEMIPQGAWVRVSALHEPTLTEIVVRGPASAGAEALQKLAHDRLVWVIRRRHGRDGRFG